jgi:3'(2'), 5'-bisphosphate nucleotidase
MSAALELPIARLAIEAGRLVMQHYELNAPSREKADKSPVTDADEAAEHLILEALARLAPGIPVVSEEAAAAGFIPDVEATFFLVDPLDGTKEFIARNGEFTVNIALIEHGIPVLGAVYAPAFARLFSGSSAGAHEWHWPVSEDASDLALESARPISARPAHTPQLALWSRSHGKYREDEYRNHYDIGPVRIVGSSLKFCLIAAAEADIYPRHGTTMEWDTAAGQAVLEAAGGSVRDLFGKRLAYGKAADKYANPSFVARGRAP